MPARNDTLKDGLSRFREIRLSVTGRNCTQWYKNVLKNPSIRIEARGAEAKLQAVPITDATGVSSVVEKFRDKYGASDVKKYYSKFDVAVLAQIP